MQWQQKENIVYCDYLEHLLLHVLICKYPAKDKMPFADVGIGGVVNFIAPELNDLYSGWKTGQSWRQNCHNLVVNDKDVYLEILKQFVEIEKDNPEFRIEMLCRCYGEQFGSWSNEQNFDVYMDILTLQ